MIKLASIFIALSIVGGVLAQAPWPQERQDRWGSGRAVIDPGPLSSPWISNVLDVAWTVSGNPSLGENNIGFYADWNPFNVYKFDYTTGTTLGTFNALGFVLSTPTIGNNGLIYAATDNGGSDTFGIDSSIMDYVWFHQTGTMSRSDEEHPSPTVGPEGDVVFGVANGNAYRWNGATGLQMWDTNGLGRIARTIVFSRDDTKVFVANGNNLTALRYSDGQVVWTKSLGSFCGAPAVADDGTVICGSDSGTIYAFEPDQGGLKWTFNTLASVYAPPAYSQDGSTAYVVGLDHRLYSFDVSTGVRNWSFTAGAPIYEAASVGYDGSIYFMDNSGELYRITPAGTQVWMFNAGAQPRGGISVGPDGTLYCTGHGMFMVRQQPTTYPITSYAIDRGSIVSGNLQSLQQIDQQYMDAVNGTTLIASEYPIRIELTATASYQTPTSFSVRLVAGVNRPHLTQFIELYNYSTNIWDLVDSRDATLADSMTQVNITTNASAYENAGNHTMQLRLGWRQNAPLPTASFHARIDYAAFVNVVPKFN
ncbi:MAG TPA: PQQ-binding-like beta-propeller repeat protein [Fimbriimonadaceae bacterium]|nr:PQQ-binding-like beta-propeller repeat protein [Fimbriimonadaceae bacterium]